MKKLCVLMLALLISGCGEDNAPPDYVRIAGGGITFNYRYSQATMVLVARTMTPLPDGATIEALFDIPGKNTRESVVRPMIKGKLTYKMESSYLTGIKKNVPLKVTLRVLDANGIVIDQEERVFTSDFDQDKLPTKPLVDPSKPNYVPQLENL